MVSLTDVASDAALSRRFGGDTFARGRAYARAGRVLDVSIGPGEPVIVATVQGSRSRPYDVLVEIGAVGAGRVEVDGGCSCPLAFDCKHVVAALIAARMQVAPPPRTAAKPAWEQSLAALIAGPSPEQSSRSPIGLQFEVVASVASRAPRSVADAVAAPPRIRIRPVVPGRSGNWVRSGISWRDLAYDVWNPRVVAHRQALQELFAAYQARSTGYYHSYGEQAVYLDAFGPSLWPLLARAADAGVAFVSIRTNQGPVRLLSEPAVVALDLVRASESADPVLEAVVSLEGPPLPMSAAHLVGRPAHGVALDRTTYTSPPEPGLTLAPLAEPLTLAATDTASAGRITIPSRDLVRFLREYYPRLRQAIALTSSDDSVELPKIVAPVLALRVTYPPDAPHPVELDWAFHYRVGDTTTRVGVVDVDGHSGLRDRRTERRLLAALRLPIDRLPQLMVETAGRRTLVPRISLTGLDAVSFTTEMLPELLRADEVEVDVVGSPADYRRSEAAPLVSVSATEAPGERDWFDLAVTVTIEGEEVPFQQLFAALALGESHLILDSGTFFSIERSEYDELRRLIDEARALQDKESSGLRLSTYQAGLWADLKKLGVVDRQSERWQRVVDGLLDLDQVPRPELPVGLRAELRPYQRDGFGWLSFLHENGLGGILADDMGLGKTVQALALILRAVETEPAGAPFLVVAPTSVVHNWALEAERFAPGLRVACITETTARGCSSLTERVAGAQVVITSYALFRIDFDGYDELPWRGLFLDEAQYVKNHQAKTYQCARRLDAPFKLAMTGTPLENNLMDLWSMLSITAPGLFPSPQRFSEFYRKPIEKGSDPALLSTLRRRIRPLMLRRTKDAVATELPPKQEQVLEVALHPKHARVYQTHLQRERQKVLGLIGDLDHNRFAIFRSLTLLRRLALAPALVDEKYADVRSSKVDAFLEQIAEVVQEGHRALVFSQFTSFLGLVRARLDVEGIATCYLDGRTRHRAAQIDAFKRGDAPVFLISLKAGGFGLNLTEADYVFVLDPWWNPAVEAQAVDRTHRIGQDKTVMVYRLVAVDTIEEKVMALKAKKQHLFDKVIDDDALMSAPLTADDVRGLFGL